MPIPQPVKSLAGKLKMNDGREIPQFGLGVYDMSSRETYKACKAALAAGYRHIDTAEWYYNEADVGKAVNDFCAETGHAREDIFVTTKLQHNRSYDAALKDLRKSLQRAGLNYFDLYLLHSPIGGPAVRKECWRALVEARRLGLAKSIGVSNFGVRHLHEIIDAKQPLPAVNQVDLHPFTRHPDITHVCEQHGILLEAWGPLARATKFHDPTIQKMAKKYNRDPAQIFLRWGLQHGYIVIPKSASEKRIVSNTEVFDFEISKEDMEELDLLNEDLVTDWWVVDVE